MKGLSQGGMKIVILGSIFYTLALTAVSLRIWAGRLKGRKLALSDWLSILSLFITTGLTALIFCGAFVGGAGYHQDQIKSSKSEGNGDAALEEAAKIVFIAEMLWLGTNTVTKLSTLALYLSIFQQDRRFRQCVYFFAAPLIIVSYIAFVLKDFLLCRPLWRNWTFEDGQFCGITTAGTLATGVIVTVTDAIVVLLPLPAVLRLQMRPAGRWQVAGVFSLGLLVCIVSGLRLDSVTHLRYDDITFTIVPLGIYTLLEPQLGLFVSTLPTLQPVFAKLLNDHMSNQTRHRRFGHSPRGSYGAINNNNSIGSKPSSRPESASGSSEHSTGMLQHSASGSLFDPGLGGLDRTHTETEMRHFNRLYDHLYPVSPNEAVAGATPFPTTTASTSPITTDAATTATKTQSTQQTQKTNINITAIESTHDLDLEAVDLGHSGTGSLFERIRDYEEVYGHEHVHEHDDSEYSNSEDIPAHEAQSQLEPFLLPPPIPPRSPLRVPYATSPMTPPPTMELPPTPSPPSASASASVPTPAPPIRPTRLSVGGERTVASHHESLI